MSKDLARQALVEAVGASSVGEYIEAQSEDIAELTSHIFTSKQKGYVGWRWSVTVFQADKKSDATVSEIVLLPGPDSIVAPDWVPWSERLADYKALQAELEAQAALDAEEDAEDEAEEEVEEVEEVEEPQDEADKELAASDVEESVDTEQDSEATSRKPRFLRRRKRLGKDKAKDKGKKPKA